MNPAVQAASEAAWRDEAHVIENRRLYREKFTAAFPLIRPPLATRNSRRWVLLLDPHARRGCGVRASVARKI